ncbi:MAG: DUF948 domain-containing protein [Deltaproteobacteria bacterium]|nr:DUF948 domain-containing protein [Deltaproteobacteria bacterium]
MTITADLNDIAIIIAVVAFLVLVIALVPMIFQIRKTVKAVEDLTVESRKTVEGVNSLVNKLNSQAGDLDELVKRVKEVGLKMTAVVELVVDNIRSPVITVLSLLLGTRRALKRLLRRDRNKGGDDDGNR